MTLGEICKVSTGEMNTQDKNENGMYPFYVRSSKIERANRYTYDGVAILTPGDGAIGQIFHYSEGKIAVHQRVYMLTEMQCIPKYLFHCFSSRFFERVSRMSAKNTVDSVRMNMITNMPIALPSLPEQRKIAALLSLIDERIEVQNAIIKEQEALKASLLRRLFDRTLHFPEFTDEWKVVKLGEICPSIQSGKDKKEEGEIPLYGAAKQLAYTRSASYSPPLILIGRVGSVGQLQWIDTPCGVSDNALVIQKGEAEAETVDTRFLFYCLKMAHLEQYAGGSSQKVITASFLKSLPLHLPPLPEQRKIAALLSAVDERIAVEKKCATLLQKQKAYLLRQMFI